ncbi:altronate hydrolase [Klebsiella oxytoca]|nr:altronate hydrolase [Klebsiella oxytoca]
MSHCRDEETFGKLVTMVNDFKQYFIAHDQPIYENPSPGNKAGGITTLEDKSLGCTQKAGSSQVVDVLRYGERLKVHGLNLLSAPGNDAVATSALAGAGCHMVLFSTGRGTPYGGFRSDGENCHQQRTGGEEKTLDRLRCRSADSR